MASATPGYVTAGCGGCLFLLSLAGALFSAFHVFLDRGGAISGREAEPGLIAGGCCTLGSLPIIIIGVVLAVRANSAAAAEQPPRA